MSGNKKRRRPISVRLSVTLGTLSILLTIGVTFVLYREYVKIEDQSYSQELVQSCTTGSSFCNGHALVALIEAAESEEFQVVRQHCEDINDWTLAWDYLDEHTDENGTPLREIYDDNATVVNLVERVMPEQSASAYIQYMHDGKTYNLIDLQAGASIMGVMEEPIVEFDGYGDNEAVPPILYEMPTGYLYSAIVPIYDNTTGEKVAQFCVDISYDDVVSNRKTLLINSILTEILLAVIFVAISIWRIQAIVVRPLKKVSDAAASFDLNESDQTYNDVIDLDLKKNDEISDLYDEISKMQMRIIDSTTYITHSARERERLKTEMDLASKIQTSVLPSSLSAHASYTVSASMSPAKSVGGDFYDYFRIDDDHLALVIADVSDKGVPAALFMMSSKIQLRTRVMEGGTPAEILSDVNVKLCRHNESSMFTTVWLGILDLKTGDLICSNAGHEYPFHRKHGGEFVMIKDKHGPALGMFSHSKYKDYTIKLEPEDMIFTYTDGVPEANTGDNVMFGIDRTRDVLNSLEVPDPASVISHVSDAVMDYLGGADQFDDVTMLCVMYHGPFAL